MQYRAIIRCRNNPCKTADTVELQYTGYETLTRHAVQTTLDNKVERTCDRCGDNDWRVIDVYPLRTKQVFIGSRD